ncbi:MAG: acyl-CoA dehydrogenase family protein [Acidimicrobiales bacterium]
MAAAQAKVKQMELWAVNHPVEFGGLGLDMVTHGLLSEAMGRSPLGHTIFGVQAPDAGNVEILPCPRHRGAARSGLAAARRGRDP